MPSEADADIMYTEKSGKKVVLEMKATDSPSPENPFLEKHSEPGLVFNDAKLVVAPSAEELAQYKKLLNQIIAKNLSKDSTENFLVVVDDFKRFDHSTASAIYEYLDGLDTEIFVSFNNTSRKMQKFLSRFREYCNEFENACAMLQELWEDNKDSVIEEDLGSGGVNKQTDVAGKKAISWRISTYFGTLTGILVMRNIEHTMVTSSETYFSSDKLGDSEHVFQNLRLPPPKMKEVWKCPSSSTTCNLSVGGHPIESPQSLVPHPIGGDSKCKEQEESSKSPYRFWLAHPLECSMLLKISSQDFSRFSMKIKSWLRRAYHSSLRYISSYLRRSILKRFFSYLHWLRCGFHCTKESRNLSFNSGSILPGVCSL